jgi:hypothetical protein
MKPYCAQLCARARASKAAWVCAARSKLLQVQPLVGTCLTAYSRNRRQGLSGARWIEGLDGLDKPSNVVEACTPTRSDGAKDVICRCVVAKAAVNPCSTDELFCGKPPFT